jgi:hypothetical protein
MAGKVFFSVTMSLDGFIAPEERTDDLDARRWMAQWMELQQWIFPQRFFRENLKLSEGGEEHLANSSRHTHLRRGAGPTRGESPASLCRHRVTLPGGPRRRLCRNGNPSACH